MRIQLHPPFPRVGKAVLMSLLCLLAVKGSMAQFVHPGALHKESDFDRMRAKVNANEEPWKSGWDQLVANSHSSASYVMRGPHATVCRGCTSGDNYMDLAHDAHAAYANAIRWKISGNTAHANKAIEILNAWGNTLTLIDGNSNKTLAAGIYGYQLANAAEIMRTYSGWSTTDFESFRDMMENEFHSICQDFLENHRNTCISHYWANWDLCCQAAVMSIAILSDHQNRYDWVVNYTKTGAGNGAIPNAVYSLHPGNLGQWQESGRDQPHSMMGVDLMSAICEMAWNNGDDLYSYSSNRFLKGAEYVARYNSGNTVPYTTYDNCDNVNQTVISNIGRGQERPAWERAYNHYVNRLGMSAPNLTAIAASVRPEGGGGDYDPNSGGYDALGYGTLLYTLEPFNGSPSLALSAVADAYVHSANTSTNYGGDTYMVTKLNSTSSRYAFMKFNLNSIPGNVISATLKLSVKSVSATSTRTVYEVANDTWTESGITWSNKPAYGSALDNISISSANNGSYVEWDITSYIAAQQSGDGVASICVNDPSITDTGIDFYSKENASGKPVLTIVYQPVVSGSTDLNPTADTYVHSTNATTNYGTATSVVTKRSTDTRYAFLKFDLGSVSGNITSAILKMNVKSVSANSTRSAYEVSTDSWTETGLTWNNKPSIGSEIDNIAINTSDDESYVEWDVTAYIASQQSGDGVASICINDPSVTNTGIDFYTKENATGRPVLTVTYEGSSSSARVADAGSALGRSEPERSEARFMSVMVYPNPARDILIINLDEKKSAKLRISTTSGKVLVSENITENKTEINIKELVPGLYIITLQTPDKILTYKLIKD